APGRIGTCDGADLGQAYRRHTPSTPSDRENHDNTRRTRGTNAMITQTPIYRAVEHAAALDEDELVRKAAEKVLQNVPDFIGVSQSELIETYDGINGQGSFALRCEQARGKLTRTEILNRV